MATPVAPKYGAGPTTLPQPGIDGFTERWEYRGSSRIMADGSITTDLVATGLKRAWSLTYTNVTTAQRTTIQTFITTLAGGSTTFYPPQETGGTTSYTVTRDENLTPIEWTTIRDGAGNFLHSVTILLREA